MWYRLHGNGGFAVFIIYTSKTLHIQRSKRDNAELVPVRETFLTKLYAELPEFENTLDPNNPMKVVNIRPAPYNLNKLCDLGDVSVTRQPPQYVSDLDQAIELYDMGDPWAADGTAVADAFGRPRELTSITLARFEGILKKCESRKDLKIKLLGLTSLGWPRHHRQCEAEVSSRWLIRVAAANCDGIGGA
ncbi:hypothetical protein C8F04DRAFT_1189827 [Mycena alexandri]|uniref:Uncharacterized protein n=1 Tax=Mycena alexandri TaxID=1745969 RepID=A0AAD6WZW9_9AGAR|nr:hypothetical protein C8F04DRAFT_1189827 [Mycena alexandri]